MHKTVSLAVSAMLAVSLVSAAAFPAWSDTSQPAATAPMDSVPEKVAPGAKPTEPPKNLSQELNQSNGVIHPKEVDPAIEQPVPKTHTDDVIKPPGTPGGAPGAQPK